MDWDQIAEEHLAVIQEVFGPLREPVETLAGEIAERLQGGGKVLVCGNGGSAADAQHMVGELVNRFLKERRPYAGIALTTDTSVLTCISNDYSFDEVFAKQVEALGQPGDVLIGISTSGNAANVCKAVEAAAGKDMLTVGFTGAAGGKLAGMVDRSLCVSCTPSTPRIQEGHELIMHLLCQRLEEILG
jgi:D-sedoheptulose 7-phosphate isomerase